MYQELIEPQKQVSKNAVKVWIIEEIIGHVIGVLFFAGLLWLGTHYQWYPWLNLIFKIFIAIIAIHSIYGIFIEPFYRQKTWRYEIHDRFIQLKYGVLEKKHLLIPMTKVQYVNMNQGIILRKYKLANITIGTMASTHEIPAIPIEEAKKLRLQIAHLAQITDTEDVKE